MTKSLVQQRPRSKWTDLDWATYLGCPVTKVTGIRNFLYGTYLTSIARNEKTGRYCFAMYKYDVAPYGTIGFQLVKIGKKEFTGIMDALRDANENIIPEMEFSDFWTNAYNVPKRALQMMLFREK